MTYIQIIEILILVFLLVISRHTVYRGLYFLQAFQQKGYKNDEFWNWIKYNFSYQVIMPPHLFVVPLFLVELFRSNLTITAASLIVIIFGIFCFSGVRYMQPEQQKKPLVFTPRMIRLAMVSVLLYVPIVWFGISTGFAARALLPDVIILSLIWVLADIFVPMLILLAATITRPVENYIQEGFKKQARKKIAGMKDLKIIAITGSYGKTSTKFILKTLLQERFNVCFTPGSYNTPMGICKVINNDLQANHQILILEMGARYRGNIKELCDIARPHVSVVTNVGKAHLETFGSIQTIARTKAEIISGLHQNGTAVINSDDEHVASMFVRKDISVINAGLETGIFSVSEPDYDQNGCRFMMTDPEGEKVEVKTPLLGEHNIRNLVLGFAVARHFGIRTQTMALAASRIEPVEHRLELKRNGQVTILDDAFNSNPVGARNAVEVLSRFEGGRRFLVTPGMIELGESEVLENQNWGEFIAEKKNIDAVLLIGPDRTRPIYEGLITGGYPEDNIHVFSSFFDTRTWLDQHQQAGDVILYENDLPDVYSEK